MPSLGRLHVKCGQFLGALDRLVTQIEKDATLTLVAAAPEQIDLNREELDTLLERGQGWPAGFQQPVHGSA